MMLYTGINFLKVKNGDKKDIENLSNFLKSKEVEGKNNKEISFNTGSENIVGLSYNEDNKEYFFSTHSYDVLEDIINIAKTYNVGLIYEFFEEPNFFVSKYYIDKKGKFIEIGLNENEAPYTYDEDEGIYLSPEDKEIESIKDYVLNLLNDKMVNRLSEIKLDDICAINKDLLDFFNNNSHTGEYYIEDKGILRIRLKDNYALDSLFYLENEYIKIEADGMYTYIEIDLYDYLIDNEGK